MKVLSFGCGVQTVTVAAMTALGDFEKPDYAVFADTQWESKATYKYLDFFMGWAAAHGLWIVRASRGNIRKDALDPNHRFASMPLWTQSQDGYGGELRRQCTKEYKIEVVQNVIRRTAGVQPRARWKGEPAEVWIGISLDEAIRMNESQEKWIRHRWPLIEKRMTRQACESYLSANGLPIPPKSACIGCPYHNNRQWKTMKEQEPLEFQDACDFDQDIRTTRVALKNPVFLHRSLVPLAEANIGENQPDLWGNECKGFCGT